MTKATSSKPSSPQFGLTALAPLRVGGLAPDLDAVELPAGVTGREIYIRETLNLGDASTEVYVYQSLTPEQALDHLVEHYKAWSVNRTGGSR